MAPVKQANQQDTIRVDGGTDGAGSRADGAACTRSGAGGGSRGVPGRAGAWVCACACVCVHACIVVVVIVVVIVVAKKKRDDS